MLFLATFLSAIGSTLFVYVQIKRNRASQDILDWLTILFMVYLVVKIAFPEKKRKEMMGVLACYLFSSAVYAGVIMFGRTGKTTYTGIYIGNISMLQLLLRSILFVAGSYIYKIAIMIRREKQQKLCTFVITQKGKSKKGIGLLDTGNLLYAPWNHAPVLVTHYVFIADFFSPQIQDMQKKLFDGEIDKSLVGTGIVWIPYKSVGNAHGLLPAFYVENVRIYNGRRWKDNPHVLVAFCREKLTLREDYDMILHTGCV